MDDIIKKLGRVVVFWEHHKSVKDSMNQRRAGRANMLPHTKTAQKCTVAHAGLQPGAAFECENESANHLPVRNYSTCV